MYYSQPDVDLEPTLDIDNLKDPDELFAAFERMEEAKKELRRQKGLPLEDIDHNRPSLPKRQRPGLSGKPAVYKHRTYSLTGLPENHESQKSPQEAYDHSMISPTREDTIPETNAMNFSSQTRVSDVKSAMSSKVSELDELLSYDYEGLDEDGVQSFLLDKLNIKLVDIGEPSLPDMPNLRRHEYASFIEALPDVDDSLLGSSKAASSKPLKFGNQYRKSLNIQVSPPLSKSPMASMSTLNKHISRLTPLKDPFSHENIDSSPEVCYHPKAQNKKQDDQIGTRFPANVEETNECVTSPCNSKNPNTEYEELLDGVGHSDQRVTSRDSHVFEKAPLCGEEDIGVSGEKLFSEGQIDESRETSQTGTRENLFDIKSLTDGENNLAAIGEASLAGAKKDVDMTTAPMEEDQIPASPKSVGKEAFNEGSIVEVYVNEGDGEMGEAPNTQDLLRIKPSKRTVGSFTSKRKETEKSTLVSQDNINVETVNRAKKMKTRSNAAELKEPKNKKKKVEGTLALSTIVDEQLAKLSLIEAGTKWEAGVRRSTRIRMRPLEFWKGERFLLGRVHEGIVSVIGVKYASPAKNAEERVVKVKSFVPDDYKALIDLASSY